MLVELISITPDIRNTNSRRSGDLPRPRAQRPAEPTLEVAPSPPAPREDRTPACSAAVAAVNGCGCCGGCCCG